MNKKNKVLIFSIFISFIIIILRIIFKESLDQFDLNFSNLIYSIRNDNLTNVMIFLSSLASYKFIIVATVLDIIIERSLCFSVGISINTLINKIIKSIVKRKRPINKIIKIGGYSFPSGHSCASMFFYGYIIYEIYISKINKYLKIILCILFSLLIISIGFSRIYLGAHYLLDVICGYSLSLSLLIIYINIKNKYFK